MTPETDMLIEDEQKISAQSLLKHLENDSSIKLITSTIPFQREVHLLDFSISRSGQDEDKIYSTSKWYRSNVRRGNTIIKHQITNKEPKIYFGRKGFEKFFDLMHEYIQFNLKEIPDLSSLGLVNADMHSELYSVIFEKVQKTFQKGQKIRIHKLVKANGENAQVSWVKDLNAWLIASKNVSMVIKDENDIKSYLGDRYHFAKLISQQWMKIVERLQKNGLLNEFQEYLSNKTLIGEYCGNQKYQHLVKYTEIEIYFVAIVDNYSQDTCISPTEAFKVFDKFKLSCVKDMDLGIFDDWISLNKSLKQIYIDVAQSSIDSEEEGSVLYMIKVDDDNKEETLSLCKLKTLEYRIYRKLREKLRGFIGQKGHNYLPSSNFSVKFQKEVEELCQYIKPPMPLFYYFDICDKAFIFAEKYYKNSSIIHNQYITFISLLMYYMSKKEELTPECFTEENIQRILPIPWAEYYKQYNIDDNNQNSNMQIENPPQIQTKLYVLVPIGIPGMGKTYFVQTLRKFVEENSFELSIISSDKVRQECMEKLSKKNKRLSFDQLFEKTGKDARNLFNDKLRELISTTDQRKSKAHFVFIDKNHPPNAINGTLDLIRRSSQHLDTLIVAITPLMGTDLFSYEEEGKLHQYPFSSNFFFTCFNRVQTRTEHETLPGNGVKTAGVLIMFLQMFRNVSLSKESLLKSGFDKHFEVPFTSESNPFVIPENLIKSLKDVLLTTKVGGKCDDESLVNILNETFEKAFLKFENPEKGLVEKCIARFFDEQILLEIIDFSKKIGKKGREIEETKDESDVIQIRGKEFEVDHPRNQSDENYNPKLLPLYLGLFVKESPIVEIKEYVLRGLNLLAKTYPYERALVNTLKDLQEGNPSDLSFTSDFHITSLYIGNNYRKKETKYFKSFRPGHKVEIEIVGFVIVPNKLAVAICYPDQSVIQIENKFPHITLMKGKWPAQTSNELLDVLFGKDAPLKEQYQNKDFLTLQEFVFKTSVKVSKGYGTAFVVKTLTNLKILFEARSSDESF